MTKLHSTIQKSEHDQYLVVGNYLIAEMDDKSLWIQNSDGEGMQTSKDKFEKAVHEFFKKEF